MTTREQVAALVEQPPIIVVGQHRSGTTLTTQMLEALGVFIGARVDQNAESTFMQRLNRRMLDEIGAHWSTPLEAHRIVQNLLTTDAIDQLSTTIGEYLQGVWFDYEYWGLGPAKWARQNSAVAIQRWGWKDPRNMLLLPIYRRLFPEFRLVWVRRHPMDTARSLYTRESGRQGDYSKLAHSDGYRRQAARAVRMLRGMPLASPAWRTSSLRGSAEVSLEYAELHESVIPGSVESHVAVDYNDLIANPAAVVEALVDHLGLTPSALQLDQAAALPRRGPGPTFRDDAELVALEREFSDRLAVLGYQPKTNDTGLAE